MGQQGKSDLEEICENYGGRQVVKVRKVEKKWGKMKNEKLLKCANHISIVEGMVSRQRKSDFGRVLTDIQQKTGGSFLEIS